MPRSCAAPSAASRSSANLRAATSDSGPFVARRSASVPPVISSNTNSPERGLGVVQRDDVGVAQPPRGLGLAREAQVGLALGIAAAPPPTASSLSATGCPRSVS